MPSCHLAVILALGVCGVAGAQTPALTPTSSFEARLADVTHRLDVTRTSAENGPPTTGWALAGGGGLLFSLSMTFLLRQDTFGLLTDDVRMPLLLGMLGTGLVTAVVGGVLVLFHGDDAADARALELERAALLEEESTRLRRAFRAKLLAEATPPPDDSVASTPSTPPLVPLEPVRKPLTPATHTP